MIAAHVSRRYASALLELGTEGGNLDALTGEMEATANAYEASEELRAALDNPVVPHPARRAILAELSDKLGVGPTAKHTVMLLGDRNRLKLLPEIAQMLREMNDQRKGLVRAEVTTAAPLSEAFYSRLKEQLEKMTGKRVVLDRKQDPALLGGVVTRLGDMVLDGSLRTRLESLRNALLPN